MRSTLERVCRKFFAAEPFAQARRGHGASNQIIAFHTKYRAPFERDFMPPSSAVLAAMRNRPANHAAAGQVGVR